MVAIGDKHLMNVRVSRPTTCFVVVIGLFALALLNGVPAAAQTKNTHTQPQTDNQELSLAIDYFQGGKYHEALLILSRLDSMHNLNPRIRAYTGLCYYYEDDFPHASRILDEVIPKLKAFSPEEVSVYCKAAAESHFALRQYEEAATAYDAFLARCKDQEKAGAYYRKGFIHIYNNEWLLALDDLQSSLVYYQRFLPDEKARIAQIRNMIEGCCEKIDQGL